MKYLFVAISAMVSLLVMLLLTKLIGCRQISELSIYDYINSITIGSIAADLAISDNLHDAVCCLIGMVIYGVFTFIFAVGSMKSKSLRNVLAGKPILLMSNATMYRENFKKARIDLDEFLAQCRIQGYFDPSKIDTAIIETNGKLSIIPKAGERPATPKDLNLSVAAEQCFYSIISDGKLQPQLLKKINKSRSWLNEQLKKQGVQKPSDVFLATSDGQTLTVFLKK